MKTFMIGLSALLLIGCASEDTTPENTTVNQGEVTELEDQLNEANQKIAELEKQLSETEADTSDGLEEETPTDNDNQTSNYYSLGEEAKVYNMDTDEDIFGFKVSGVTKDLSVDSEYYTDGKPDNTIEITYEYTNYSLEEAYIVSSQFVNAYDSNGKAGKNMGFQDGQTEVTAGRTAESTVWIVMEEPVESGDTIEVEYGGDFVYGFNDYITFSVDIE